MTTSLHLQPAPGYTPTVGAIVTMLDQARASTLEAVAGLSVAELDHQHDATANPIGAMLAHIAAIEWAYTVTTLGGAPPTGDEWARWMPLMRLGEGAWAAARGQSLEALVEQLAAVRERTREGLRRVDDAWLSQELTLPWLRQPATNLWAWYHVMEDELNHRGQIRWLRSRLPNASQHNA